MKIFICHDGEVSGPFSRFEVFAGLQKGTFANDDDACLEGGDEWKPLQQLLTGNLGLGGRAPIFPPLDPVVPAVPEPAATPALPKPAPAKGRPLPTLLPRFAGWSSETVADRLKGLGVACALFGLLFLAIAALSLAVGRSRFLHRAYIVAIETNRPSSGQKSTPTSTPPERQAAAIVGPHVLEPALGGKLAPAPEPTPGGEVKAALATGVREAPANIPPPPRPGSPSGAFTGGEPAVVVKSGRKKLFETPRFTPRELVEVLTERFAATPVNTAASAIREDPNITIREGSFVLDTGLAWNPKVEVVYSIPLYKSSTAGPRAANMVMWADWPAAMTPPKENMINGKLVREKSNHYNRLEYYTRELGYTAFSMHFVTRAFNDPQETYFLGGPQWVDLVFKAQDELTRMFKLPPRKLMVSGMSLGATFAERIAAARPDKVAAAALLSAPEISLPKEPSDTVWYLQINRGDSMQEQYETLYNALRSQNDKVLFDIFPPNYAARGRFGNMYHTESALDTEATRSFLEGVASRRDAAGNVDPANWPFIRDQDHPYFVLSRTSSILDRIAPAKREFLPSERMVHCLQSLPVPVHSLVLPQPDGKGTRCFVGLPPLGRPRGVLVYAPEASYKGITDMFNDVYFLAEKGYLVLCPYTTQPGGKALSATLKFIQGTPLLNNMPVVLVGIGERAIQLWQEVSRSNLSPSAMVLLKFKPGDLFDESRLTVDSHPIRFPVLFVEDETELLKVSTTEAAKENLMDAHQIDSYIARCRERHQISRVVMIPASDSSEERDAQKTVQAINDAFADLVEGHRGTIIK